MADRAGAEVIETGSTATTYWIDTPCKGETTPCEISQVDHFGLPTPHLLCGPHGKVVGHVS